MIILRRDVIRVMREALERLVGEQAAPFLSFLASGVGVHEGSIFRDSITSTGQEQKASLESLIHSAFEDTNLGLGKVQIRRVDFDNATANVAIGNCFEAMENGTSEDPNCMFTSGFLAGLFAEVFDKTLQAKETHCISQGQTECEFELSPVESTTEEIASPIDANKEEPEAQPGTAKSPVESTTTKSTVEASKSPSPTENSPEPKLLEKPTAVVKNEASTKESVASTQTEMDAGLERASRIARRKQGFWEKHFNKKK